MKQTTTNAAIACLKKGFDIIPLHAVVDGVCTCNGRKKCRPGKHPRFSRPYQRIAQTVADIRAWPWREFNIGIVAGKRFVIIDVDAKRGGSESFERLLARFPQQKTVATLTGSGGKHVYFSVPSDWDGSLVDDLDELGFAGIDIQHGDKHVVAPPGANKRGSYRWQQGLSPFEIDVAPISAKLLKRLTQKRRALPSKPLALIALSERLSKARAYLRKLPPAISGQRGHDRLWDTAMKIGAGFDLPTDEALSLLEDEYNSKCEPPWSREELLHKLKGVARITQKGFLLKNNSSTKTHKKFPLTDSGNAERLVYRFGARLRHSSQFGWLAYYDGRWHLDAEDRVRLLAKKTVREISAERKLEAKDQERAEIRRHAQKSESRSARNAMVDLARSEPGIEVTAKDLDRDPMLFNVKNGTIDLRTGILRRQRKTDLITKMAPVIYDDTSESLAASAPTFLRFLETVLPDKTVRSFLQRFFGLALIGEVRDHVLLFLFGRGRNGKSTLLSILQEAFGDYAIQANSELLVLRQHRAHPTERATLMGRRLAVCGEIQSDCKLDTAQLKHLTGGDAVNARFMNKDEFSFTPSHTLVWVGNHCPVIRETGPALWERFLLVEFGVAIPRDQRDPLLKTKLRKELPGILKWAVEGCLEYQRKGLSVPEVVRHTTHSLETESDSVGAFVTAQCKLETSARVSAKELFQSYLRFCDDSGVEPLSQRMFGGEMTGRFARKKTKGVFVYSGIRILKQKKKRPPSPLQSKPGGMKRDLPQDHFLN